MTGEQKLRSLLMEPVQRLPRYSLLIDAMTATMPAPHPAVKQLLKARDIITNICALEKSESDEHMRLHRQVTECVGRWPSSLGPQGRLIAAMDVESLKPPYRLDYPQTPTPGQMLILFTSALVLVDKSHNCALNARTFLSKISKAPSYSVPGLGASEDHEPELLFSWSMPTNGACASHSVCGRVLHLTCSEDSMPSYSRSGSFTVVDNEPGKVVRFCEDLSKAKVEHRFSDQERSGDKWTLHSIQGSSNTLSFFTAVCEEKSEHVSKRNGFSDIRIVFGKTKAEKQQMLNTCKTCVLVFISRHNHRFKVEIDHCFGNNSIDVINAEEFVDLLSRRLSSLMMNLHSLENPGLVDSLTAINSSVVDAICFRNAYPLKSIKGLRRRSPTKLLASIWGGTSTKENNNEKSIKPTSLLGNSLSLKASVVPPSPPQPTKVNIERSDSRVKIVANGSKDTLDVVLAHLEQTFTAYILSIRSRAGNIVGKSLRSRELTDQVATDDLYNLLLDDPSKIQAAAEVANDVLFNAFERFLWEAWKADIGPIISMEGMKCLQHNYITLLPVDFEMFFEDWLNNFSPQNRRALAAIIKLLADLLDASGNDGDRGALTLAFAELLSGHNDSLACISLLDRLVDDYEILFDDNTTVGFPGQDFPSMNGGPQTSHGQAGKVGSVNSQTSSFRRRFGFGSSKEPSKQEGESKVSSIIRTLSKSKSGNESTSQPPSLSKSSLVRSKSTDSDSRIAAWLRPLSRERPLTSSSSENKSAPNSRPTSTHSNASVLPASAEEELKAKLAAAMEETARLRRENLELKRQLAGVAPPARG